MVRQRTNTQTGMCPYLEAELEVLRVIDCAYPGMKQVMPQADSSMHSRGTNLAYDARETFHLWSVEMATVLRSNKAQCSLLMHVWGHAESDKAATFILLADSSMHLPVHSSGTSLAYDTGETLSLCSVEMTTAFRLNKVCMCTSGADI